MNVDPTPGFGYVDSLPSGLIRIGAQKRNRVCNLLRYALTLAMTRGPKLKIFNARIGPIPISMMNRFLLAEWTANMLFHHQAVYRVLLLSAMDHVVSIRGNNPNFRRAFAFLGIVSAVLIAELLFINIRARLTLMLRIGLLFSAKATRKLRSRPRSVDGRLRQSIAPLPAKTTASPPLKRVLVLPFLHLERISALRASQSDDGGLGIHCQSPRRSSASTFPTSRSLHFSGFAINSVTFIPP